MAVSMENIKKLRTMTGAGMMDCKNALAEAEGDMDKAIELIRKRGQAIAAKRSDREASEGCVLSKAEGNFAAIVAVKCETDFVAKNADFIGMVQEILDLAIAKKPATIEELKALKLNDLTVEETVTERSGVTGEKMELSDYVFLNAPTVDPYNHLGNKLSSIVAFAEADADQELVHGIAMQVAAMAPIALDVDSVDPAIKERELNVAIEKTKQDEINKAVENAIRKVGINPAHVDSDDHIDSNMAKGWITPEQAEQAREIRKTVAEEAAQNVNEKKVEMIAQGRLQKFLKESTLMEQTYVMSEEKALVKDVLKQAGITCTGFKRITLNQE